MVRLIIDKYIDGRGITRYELAKRGTMRLMPPEYNLAKLRADYDHMRNMLFGDKPSFEEIMDGIAKLETEINNSI